MGNSDSFDLVLSTWFVMYLHEDLPGGLPNDFLSHGATALLVFDRVVCDENALAAEARFAGRWLSSDLLMELRQERLLHPVDMSSMT